MKNFPERCALAAQCLPDAEYRTSLEILHVEMLHEIGRLREALQAMVECSHTMDVHCCARASQLAALALRA